MLIRSPWTVTISCSPIQTHQNQTRWISIKVSTSPNLTKQQFELLWTRPKPTWSRLKSKSFGMSEWGRKSCPHCIVDPKRVLDSFSRCICWIVRVRWSLPVVTRKTSWGGIYCADTMITMTSKRWWQWRPFHRAEDEHPDFIHAFNAYTPPGDVTGDLVFVPSWFIITTKH